jgi:hypothetical protein
MKQLPSFYLREDSVRALRVYNFLLSLENRTNSYSIILISKSILELAILKFCDQTHTNLFVWHFNSRYTIIAKTHNVDEKTSHCNQKIRL